MIVTCNEMRDRICAASLDTHFTPIFFSRLETPSSLRAASFIHSLAGGAKDAELVFVLLTLFPEVEQQPATASKGGGGNLV